MIYFIIVLGLLLAVPLAGMLNYYIRRNAVKSVSLPWFSPDNLVDINGVKTHILIKGQGEPLFLIHGSQMNIYDWRYNIDHFARYFKVYALDMPGCGFSDKPKADYSPGYFAGHIHNVMKHFNINKASFIGSSWGGGHVLDFALRYPEKVSRLILSSPCDTPHKMNLIDTLLGIPVLSNIIMFFASRLIVRSQLNIAFEKKELINKELVESVYIPLLSKGAIGATVNAYRNADFTYVRENLHNIQAPSLIFWGTKDRIHAKWMMDEIASRLQGSKLIIIPNAGHMPHEEAADKFNSQAAEFLMNRP